MSKSEHFRGRLRPREGGRGDARCFDDLTNQSDTAMLAKISVIGRGGEGELIRATRKHPIISFCMNIDSHELAILWAF